MVYHLSIKARNDLQGIWFYSFENWSFEQADRYVSLIISEVERHAANPGHGRDRSSLREGYRSFQVKSHVVFYRTIKEKTEIEVIRVLHKSMDIENRLRDQ